MRLLLFLSVCAASVSAATYQPGWTYLANTTFATAGVAPPDGFGGAVCPPDVSGECGSPGGPVLFSSHAAGIIDGDWSGGVLDPVHNRLLFWGGGHGDYYGNEIYSVNLSGTPSLSRLTNPTVPIADGTGCPQSAQFDGNPMPRHTYSGLVNIGTTGYLYQFNGSVWPCGSHLADTWILNTNTATPTWIRPTIAGTGLPNPLSAGEYACTAWDSVGNRGMVAYAGNLWAFTWNSSTSTITYTPLVSDGSLNAYQPSCDIDPVMRTPLGASTAGRWFVSVETQFANDPTVALGNFRIMAVDISGNDPSYTVQNWTAAANGTCTALRGNTLGYQGPPGWAYDDALGMFVGFPLLGGNTVYLYSVVTQTCVPMTFPNGPGAGGLNGVFGRWRYVKNGNYFVGLNSSTQNAFVLNLDAPIPGLGASTSTCIDADGDGYGTGSGCLGPDANDQDATVHTAAQAIAKYGSIDATFQLRNYHPTRYWTVDPAAGNDGTGASCTPANLGAGGGSDCKPFQHWSALSGSVAAGDAVVFRSGTYSYPVTIAQGTSSASVYYLAYPGESATFAAYPNYWTVIDKAYWVIDGLRFDGQGDSTSGTGCIVGGTGDLQSSSTQHDFIVRNVECKNWLNGPYMFNGLQNGLIEFSSFHDMTGSHGIYLGSRAMASTSITVRRNLLYRNSRCGVQFNGRVSDLHIEQNYAYQNGIVDGGDDICLENGVHDSFIRGNVSLGSAFGITMNTYDGSEFGGVGSSSNCGAAQNQNCTCGASPNLFAICAFSEFNNLFSNNTAVNTGQDVNGADISGNPLYQIGRQPTDCTTATCLATSFPNNTWQNMVILSKGLASFAPPWTFTGGTTAPESGPTNTLNQVVYFQTAGTAEVVGYGLQVGCCGYQSYSCAAAVSGGHIGSATNCTKSDPKFTALGAYNNIAGYNLRLQPSSPALTGAIIPGSLPMDILGAPIVSGSLGAYEGTVVAIPSITFGGRVVIHP
ncbi:MAG TPA: hypothetical protein VN737_04200 [Bryobacteraceae bacterium]|nr:hypothetical protein [Bryobacteraceae bacterium]